MENKRKLIGSLCIVLFFLLAGIKYKIIFLGIAQGIFEWIPISSEGIVALFSEIFYKDLNPIDIALFLHFGTLLAVLFYFRKEWIEVVTLKNYSLLKFLIICTIVSLIVGFPVYKLIKQVAFGYLLLIIVGFGLILTSLLQSAEKRSFLTLTPLAIITGLLQGLSVIPGLSRSGSTIFGLSLGKLKPSEILKISYMASVPVIFASSIYFLLKTPSLSLKGLPALFSSAFIGFLTLDMLMSLAKRINFAKFTFIFGVLCLIGGIIFFAGNYF